MRGILRALYLNLGRWQTRGDLAANDRIPFPCVLKLHELLAPEAFIDVDVLTGFRAADPPCSNTVLTSWSEKEFKHVPSALVPSAYDYVRPRS